MRSRILLKILTCCLSLLLINGVQAAPPIPVSTASPAVAKNRLSAPTPGMQPVAMGVAVSAPKPQAPTAFAGAEQIKLQLNQVIIEGNTVYSTAVLQQIFQSSIGKEISLLDLQNMVYDITQKYRRDGYILSRAFLPAQSIKNGVVKVQIVEGYINEVTVTGDPGRIKPMLLAYGAKIAASRPLRLQVIERYLLLANDLSGTNVKAVLTPSPTTPGASELSLVTQQQFAQGYVYQDNYGTRYLGPQQTTLGGNLNSVFASGDTNSVRIVNTADPNELRFLQLIHAQPLGASGARWSVAGNYTRTNPGFLLNPLDVIGVSRSVQSDVAYPIIRSRASNLTVHAGANYENDYSTISAQQFYDDHLRTMTAGGSYDFSDRFLGINTMQFDVQHGFNILGANNGGDRSRPQGRSDFTKFNLAMYRLQSLGSRFSALAAVQGQYACSPLLAASQFTFGGPDFGRGYDPAEFSGDDGIAGKAELRMDTQPELRLLQTVQYYIFYDAGKIWNLSPLVPPSQTSANSAGLGTRMNFTRHFAGDFFLAKPLTRPETTLVALGENGQSWRSYFQLRASF